MQTDTGVRLGWGQALITGAYGGMGRACARTFGRNHNLFLTDLDPERLEAFADSLREEGFPVAGTLAADLTEASAAMRVVDAARAKGRLRSVIHTAGVSPTTADSDQIIAVNAVATEAMLRALETDLEEDLALVMIASMAGHTALADPDLDALFDAPLAADFLARVNARLPAVTEADDSFPRRSFAYAQTKRAVIRWCAARAGAWGLRGARLATISPGIIWTPMGRLEAKPGTRAAEARAKTPLGRWGTALDIALAAAFLASDEAGFITGTDLRVDGGVTPVRRSTLNARGSA